MRVIRNMAPHYNSAPQTNAILPPDLLLVFFFIILITNESVYRFRIVFQAVWKKSLVSTDLFFNETH